MSEHDERPRYTDLPLPPYSYVSGFAPHPVSDARGHMHGQPHAAPPPLDPHDWQASTTYRYAADLFNHGFYWEAHEAWEALWHAAGRQGQVATWLKALIKLAAAGVKLREGNAAGVQRHARRAVQLLAELRKELPHDAEEFSGLKLRDVEAIAQELTGHVTTNIGAEPRRVLKHYLELQ
jgi:hypothetical protein